MLGLKKVAVTGGPASGKSLVCHFLKEQGAFIVSADEIVHQLYSQDQEIKEKVIALLGEEILTDHQIDRKKVAKIVFNNEQKLQALENYIHPKVREKVNEEFNKVIEMDPMPSLFVVEIPLLFESSLGHAFFDKTVAVATDPNICHKRYQGDDYEHRAKRFLPDSKRKIQADYVIENNGTLDELKQSTINLFHQICK